ncbi:MAG: hypothetical protein J4473_04435 [Candidatus Aenigmarchaeota archaeon]|nr:hypothetical protein [Candidatus Aenigmarchaeota archaeon]
MIYNEQTEYSFWIDWPREDSDPADELADVRLNLGDREYSAPFATLNYAGAMVRKNKEDCGCPAFYMRGLVIVKEITKEIVKNTIDYMMKEHELEDCFTEWNGSGT